MHLVGFYYRNTFRCTALWTSKFTQISEQLKRNFMKHKNNCFKPFFSRRKPCQSLARNII